MIPHCSPPSWPPDLPDGKFASTILTADPKQCSVALLGMPDDTGIRLNNGRPGAQEGPDAFRRQLAAYGCSDPTGLQWPRVFDAGNILPASDIHETHDRVTQAVSALLDLGLFPIGIGGGHDLTFPFVRAVATRHEPMTGIYFDAHLDVREETGSGMPFRKLVEECGVKELHVHGLDPNANQREHVRWFTSHGGHIDRFGPGDPWPEGDLFVSFDMDVMNQSDAPGVSAMNPCGWLPSTARTWVLAAGANPRVRCFDIMELSPPHDESERTSRFAAFLFLTFLRGFSTRLTPTG